MKLRLSVLVLFMAVIATASAAPKEDQTYSGEYFYNFENSFLTPDGKDEEWCINSPLMAKAMLPAKDENGKWGTSHVVVRGKLGPEGSYGGLGRCKRILDVTALVKITNMRGRE